MKHLHFSSISETFKLNVLEKGYSSRKTIDTVIFLILLLLLALLFSNVASAANETIIVATNRFVILDDPPQSANAGKTAQTTANFSLPPNYPWSSNSWSGNQTTVKGYALLLDKNGSPIINAPITFKLSNWNNADSSTLGPFNTNSNGIATFTFDMNNKNYYGNWYVNASALGKSDSTGFIYNWWGCNAGGCQEHGGDGPGSQVKSKQNSPYTLGRESVLSNNHHPKNDNNCVGCHRSYSGAGGGNTFGGQAYKTSDVHKTDTCSTCHAGANTHTSDEPIKSCTDCHSWVNLTKKSTIKVGSPANMSNYSGSIAATGHNPNSTIPCIICHGPMHNITKPDESLRFLKNTYVEETQCTTCHISKGKHSTSDPVYCTACHSMDAHMIKVLGTDGAYKIRKSAGSISSGNDNCIDCHKSGQPANFFRNLTSVNPQAYSTNFDPYGLYNAMHPTADCTNSCHDTSNFHNIGEGGGGPDCLFCHNSSGSARHRVDGSAINIGIHSNLNPKTPSNPNSKCWGCHDSTGNEPSNSMGDIFNSPYKCTDCHTSTGQKAGVYGAFIVDEHSPSGIDIKAISGISNLGACILCHNKTGMKVNYISPDNIFTNYSLVSHYGKNRTDIHTANETNCAYCHNATSEFNDLFQDANNTQITHNNGQSCLVCHREIGSTNGRIHDAGLVGGGGPDCILCHDVGKSAQHRVNNAAISSGVHANINSGAAVGTGISPDNKKCWGCHQSDGKQPTGMGDKYNNPYKCYECHGMSKPYAGVSGAPTVSEHFKGGADIIAAETAPDNSSSCILCHNLSEMKVTYTEDDVYKSNYSLASHYDKNRGDIHNSNETNCDYCHKNATTAFKDVFGKVSNTQITHNNGNSCYLCHRTEGSIDGRIHDSTLVGGGGNDCIACHSPIDVNISKFGRHANINTSDGDDNVTNADCWTCHYQKDMNRSHVYLCESCHIDSNGVVTVTDPSLIKGDFMHGITACKGCHAPITYHFKSTVGPLGVVENILRKIR